MQEKNYRDILLKKIGFIRIIFLGIIGFFTAFMAMAIAVLFYYAHGGNNFSIYMVLFGLLFFIAVGIFINYFFKSYIEVINLITENDLENLERLGESRWWLDKYLPSFIIYSGKIRVFKLYRQPDLYFNELSEISIRTNYFSRSRQNKLVIFKKIKGGSYFFGMDSNPAQQKHLLDKAVEYNPNVIIKNR